jgi:hypothetical protein
MKTYFLKYEVINSMVFPAGTIVKVIDPKWEFEVVEGKLKGKRGNIAEGLNGWLIENNITNKDKIETLFKKRKKILKDSIEINKEWEAIESAIV